MRTLCSVIETTTVCPVISPPRRRSRTPAPSAAPVWCWSYRTPGRSLTLIGPDPSRHCALIGWDHILKGHFLPFAQMWFGISNMLWISDFECSTLFSRFLAAATWWLLCLPQVGVLPVQVVPHDDSTQVPRVGSLPDEKVSPVSSPLQQIIRTPWVSEVSRQMLVREEAVKTTFTWTWLPCLGGGKEARKAPCPADVTQD